MRSQCKLPECGWESDDQPELVVKCFAVWHVYEDHHDVWHQLAGPRAPQDPDPRTPEGLRLIMGALGAN